MTQLQNEIQRLEMQLELVKTKMNANTKNNKDKQNKLRWYKEYTIVKSRLNELRNLR